MNMAHQVRLLGPQPIPLRRGAGRGEKKRCHSVLGTAIKHGWFMGGCHVSIYIS